MIIYEKTEDLRIGIFKNISFYFGSVFGLFLIQLMIFGENIEAYYNIRGLGIAISFVLSYFFALKSMEIAENLDKNIYTNHLGENKCQS